jgi:hypothetical protein
MAYSGGVKFIDVHYGGMEWIDSLKFDEENENAIIASLWTFRDCTLVPCESYHEVQDLNGAMKGRIDYDLSGDDVLLDKENCVVVGRKVHDVGYEDGSSTGTEYRILVVQSTAVDGEYKRVGTGKVLCSHVVWQKANVRIV